MLPRGKLRFTITEKSVNAETMIDFIKRLVQDTGRKVLLILDNLPAHHAKVLSAWLAEHRDEIELFYLPPYAPEYNPDEYLNSDMKRSIGRRPMPRSKNDLSKNARSFLKQRQLQPAKSGDISTRNIRNMPWKSPMFNRGCNKTADCFFTHSSLHMYWTYTAYTTYRKMWL